MTPIDLFVLNHLPSQDVVEALGGVFEHAPWVVEEALAARPFATIEELFAAMTRVVREASPERIDRLIAGHPELAGEPARKGELTPESAAEQSGAGLTDLSEAELARFRDLNGAYGKTFGFPFIVCVRRHGKESILRQFETRLGHSRDEERRTALDEILRIAALRLSALVSGPGPLTVTGRLSTHVLDTSAGRPAAGVTIRLVQLTSGGELPIASAATNADGRTDQPLIGGRPIPIGTYELRFGLGDYFRHAGTTLPEPAFLDVVPIRFGVHNPEGHYHVPLVATPWSYATYRGS